MKVPAGTMVKLTDVKEETLDVSYNGGAARVAPDATDIRQRAHIEMAKPKFASTPDPASFQPQALPQRGKRPEQMGRAAARKGFVHPGLMHTEADFDRMRAKVKAEASPWIEGWNVLTSSRHAQLGWRPRPTEKVVRSGQGQNFPVLFNDIHAAYQLALRWKISGDREHAEKAIEILNVWSSTLKEISGNADRFLAAGIYGYQFANAAEIMRTCPRWKASEFKRFQTMMLEVFYPLNQSFLFGRDGGQDRMALN